MSLKLTILGCNSATPTSHHHPTAQLLELAGRSFLIDCGEGTQVQMRKYKIRFTQINHIFISHLHGDHFYGLIGLISSFQLLGRIKPLYVYAPPGLEEIIELQLRLTQSQKRFAIHYIETNPTSSEKIFEDDKLEVQTIPLNHRVPCNGYLFKEKLKWRHLNMEAISKIDEIAICDYTKLKKGFDFVKENGEIIKNEILTLPPSHALSYAFCSDTSYKPSIVPLIQGVDLLYHESTFLDSLGDLATKTGHSTAKQAAQIAFDAQVKNLVLGHYSNRYKSIEPFKKEAQTIFLSVELAESGKEFKLFN